MSAGMSALLETIGEPQRPATTWTCIYPGTPHPQLRARAVSRGTHARVHANPKSAERQASLRSFLADRWTGEPLTGPVSLSVRFYFYPPRSWPAWKRTAALEAVRGIERHTSRPDVDNLLKLVKDAGSGVLWADDSQVHKVNCSKRWADVAQTIITLDWCAPVPTRRSEL